MGIVLVVGVTAQRLVLIGLKRIDELIQISIEIAIGGIDVREVDTEEAIGLAVALGIAVLIAITELQVNLTGNGLAIVHANGVAPIVLRCEVVTVGNRRIRIGEKIDVVVGHRLAGAFTPVGIELDGDVTTVIAETAVELQHTTQVLRVAIVDTIAYTVVLDDIILLGNIDDIAQGVVSIVVRILVEGSVVAPVSTVVRAIREVFLISCIRWKPWR